MKTSLLLSELIGKPVRERYGRFKGTVVAIETTPDGEGKAIVYENGGILVRSDVSSFHSDGAEVEVAHPTIYAAEKLRHDLSFLLVQRKSIVNLRGKGTIPHEIFTELQKELDSRHESLSETLDKLVKKLGERLTWIDKRRDWIHRLIMNLELAHKMKMLRDEEYGGLNEKLKEELSCTLNEAEEIKKYRADISSISTSIKETRQETPETSDDIQSAML